MTDGIMSEAQDLCLSKMSKYTNTKNAPSEYSEEYFEEFYDYQDEMREEAPEKRLQDVLVKGKLS